MNNPLSEESKDILRDMLKSPAWEIFERVQEENVRNLRDLATSRTSNMEDRLWYSALAQGREDTIRDTKSMLYEQK